MTALRELADEGPRVLVRTVRPADVPLYRRAVQASRARLARWNPVDPDDLLRHLARQSDVHRTFLVLARDPEGAHGVVGRINLTNIVRGRFESGVLGYDAFDPYAGRGLFAEGLSLVVGLALRPAAEGGAGLHRVEANVQPGNARSAGLLRSLGFRHEGRTPRMLLLAAPGEGERWRDHERYAVTAEQWPAPAYAPPGHPRLVVLVGGPAADRRAALSVGLATELGLPRLVGAPWPDEVPSTELDSAFDSAFDSASADASGRMVHSAPGSAGDSAPGSAADSAPGSARGSAPGSARGSAPGSVPGSTPHSTSDPAHEPAHDTAPEPAHEPAPEPAHEPAPDPALGQRSGEAFGIRSGLGVAPASGERSGRTSDPAGLDAATLWAVLASCPTGAVVDVPCGPGAAPELQAGLHRAGIQVADAVQVWCADPARTSDAGAGWGLRHAVPLDPQVALTAAEVTRVALAARALAAP